MRDRSPTFIRGQAVRARRADGRPTFRGAPARELRLHAFLDAHERSSALHWQQAHGWSLGTPGDEAGRRVGLVGVGPGAGGREEAFGGDLSESTHRPPSSSCSTRSPQALAAGERARENSCASTPPRPGAPRSRPRGGCARRAPAGEPRPLCPLAVTWSAMSSRPRPPGPPDKTGRSTLPPEVHAPPLELWTSPMGRRVARREGAYMITSARTAPHRHMRPVVRPVPRPPSVENRNVW